MNAEEFLRSYRGSFGFLQDMQARVESGRGLSENMRAAVERCMARETRPVARGEVMDLSGVLALLRTAAAHLQYPKIRLGDVRVAYRSRKGEAVILSEDEWVEGRFGPQRRFLGKVAEDGTASALGKGAEAVRRFSGLTREEAIAELARMGRLSGNCMFCMHELTDERSTAAGYGPICAGHYGLPWG